MRQEPKELTAMRDHAKDYAKVTGVKYCHALNRVANLEGYKNWTTLLKEHPCTKSENQAKA